MEFRNISFKYPGTDVWALRNVSRQFRIGQQLAVIAHSGPDLVEFRADWYADIMDRSARRFALDGIRTVLPQTPLLFTYRTRREGGESELADADYLRLCLEGTLILQEK